TRDDGPRRDPERVLRAAGPAVPDGGLRATRRAVSGARLRRRDVAHGPLGARVPGPGAGALRVGPPELRRDRLRARAPRSRGAPRVVYLVTAVWTVLLFVTAARLYWSFGDTRDLEVFDQALWNTTHGRFYRSSIVGGVNLFSEHFDPLHLVLVGAYALHASPL